MRAARAVEPEEEARCLKAGRRDRPAAVGAGHCPAAEGYPQATQCCEQPFVRRLRKTSRSTITEIHTDYKTWGLAS